MIKSFVSSFQELNNANRIIALVAFLLENKNRLLQLQIQKLIRHFDSPI